MFDLDLKDRKILYELDFDSRQSYRSLARKVGLSKDVVLNRINRLQEKGILTGFYAIIDYAKLGYSLYRFYFSFQNLTPEIKKEIIDFFVKEKGTDSVITLEGSYDLFVTIYVKNFPEAHSFWIKTLQKYGKYFSKKIFAAYCQEDCYGNRFLLDKKDYDKKIIYQWFDSGNIIKIDDLDQKILELISQNSRLPTIEIAKQLKTSGKVIHNRLKKLIESKIIIAYRISTDLTKLGYYQYKVYIELNRYEELGKIIKFLEDNPNFVELVKTIGYVDLEVAFVLNNSFQLHQIIEDLSNRFPNAIKNYSYMSWIKVYKAYIFDKFK